MYNDTSVIENQQVRSPLGDCIVIMTVRNLQGELKEENITISYYGEQNVSQ
jgi:hypothetical protein